MRKAVLLVVVLTFLLAEKAADKSLEVDTTRVPDMDIFADETFEFLDIDYRGYLKKGYEAYNEERYEEAAKWYTAALRHDPTDIFAGTVPWGGWLDDKWIGEMALSNAKEQSILIVHGAEDKRIGYEIAENAR